MDYILHIYIILIMRSNLRRDNMKKFISFSLLLVLIFAVGCTKNNENTSKSQLSQTINVVSREDGSGTRGAFSEILGILKKDSLGNETDLTYDEAIIQNSTDGIMTTVAGDKYAIGYISLGSLGDTVKPLKIDGINPTAENIQEGSYKIARPFNIVHQEELNSLGVDFINFILSSQGQDILSREGYIKANTNLSEYNSTNEKGNLVISGSTSIAPVMEKLAEEYKLLNPNSSIEIQSTGSSAGIQGVIEGSADIGMASRELKDSEKETINYKTIAMDGIVIIVNNENIIENLSIEDVRSIYIGQTTTWNDLEK